MGGGGDSLIKVGISGFNFCLGIRFWEVNLDCVLGFWQFLTRKCVIFDKSEKSDLLAENFNFGTLKFMKTCPVIRFLGTFLPGHWVF